MSVLDRSALEASPLADLHAIASELGIDGFRRLRKEGLIEAILERQGGSGEASEEPASAETDGGADAAEAAVAADVDGADAAEAAEAADADGGDEAAEASESDASDEDEATDAMRGLWSVGQLAGRGDTLVDLWPFAAIGLVLALCCGGRLNALMLANQAAIGLGVRVRRVQIVVAVVAVLLCAAATAAVGPVAFVGLVGAHLGRLIVGADQRRLIPYGMLCGALLLVGADVLGRLGPGNGEIPVGIMTALVGTPFFVVLARRRRLVQA